MRTLQKVLKLDLILQIMNEIDHCLKQKKRNWVNETRIRQKIMKKIFELRAKTYSYLINEESKDKKVKDTKKCAIKRKLMFESYENCLEATQLEDKITYLEKQN